MASLGLGLKIRKRFMNINETLKGGFVDVFLPSSMAGILSACHHKPQLLSHVAGFPSVSMLCLLSY